MCGIAGAIGPITDRHEAAVAAMNGAQTHRGPDQEGRVRFEQPGGGGVVLGHRRLSILDLSEAGRQPMVDEATGVALAFNGEVYNFPELRDELREAGVSFRSTSDTEVVLAAYVRWGLDVVTRLRGMFAMAIYDPREGVVHLVRDRLGIKPLYFTTRDAVLLFASEVRGLLASDLVPRRIDPVGVEGYLWHGFVPGPRTIIEGVQLLPPGHTLSVRLDGGHGLPRRYWSPPRSAPIGESDAVDGLAKALEDAVAMRLVADVPLGVFLSGGVDSSAIAALAQRRSDSPVRTFNVAFDEARYDESSHARTVAETLGTDHQEVRLTEAWFAEHLDDALASLDQPTFDAVNTYVVSRAVREAGLTVALAGTGGDELFGGYTSFRDVPKAAAVAKGLAFLPDRMRAAAAALGSRLRAGAGSEVPPQTRWGKLEDALAAEGDRLAAYQVSYGLFRRDLGRSLTLRPSDSLVWGLDPARAAELRESIAGQPDLPAVSTLELASFIGERLLRDTDAASMAVSLEVRVPLLDHEVVEAAAKVPLGRRYQPLQKKALLRELVSRELDPSLFDRPKAGFELPLAIWCKQRLAPVIEAELRDVGQLYRIGLDGEAVGRVWRAFRKGGPGLYWSRVWSLYVLSRWCRTHGVTA